MAYSSKVIDHYENPRNVGSMDKASADVVMAAPSDTAPIGDGAQPPLPRQLEFDTSGFVQMELLGLDAREVE